MTDDLRGTVLVSSDDWDDADRPTVEMELGFLLDDQFGLDIEWKFEWMQSCHMRNWVASRNGMMCCSREAIERAVRLDRLPCVWEPVE